MTQPNLDPDEAAHQKAIQETNYHDEEPEIRDEAEPEYRRLVPPRKDVRRPPPRKWYHEE